MQDSVREGGILGVVLICVAMGVGTVLVHHAGLQAIARHAAARRRRPGAAMLGVIFGIFAVHLVEIALYAAAFYLAVKGLRLGRLVGQVAGTDLEILYFSAETYTTLGFGDIVPDGPLRLLASFEPLNGLILLGWSASFMHVEMQRLAAPAVEVDLAAPPGGPR